jgi:hypothetical protein
MLERVAGCLTKPQRKVREQAIAKALAWVKRAGAAGGVVAQVSVAFQDPRRKDERIDIEVRSGRAFVP